VMAVLIWLYCDDTSGNRSKKWNEHYSWLFALAGLSKGAAKGDYHIHFVCTSNIAQTVEMMEGVVEQIEELYRVGMWAYDAMHREAVLLFAVVFALLGDNPMQSEMACHISLKGKFFCCCCWVKGHDAREAEDDDEPPAEAQTRASTPGPRASLLFGGFMVCMDPLHSLSPVGSLALEELDPHAHMPVEVLYVLLLGIVCYFWRDAVARTSDTEKQVVTTRLACLEVDGLGPSTSKVAGRMFFQYMGSLVGRDFRIPGLPLQLGLFALYDILPAPALKAWAALSHLVPMVWQLSIAHVDAYLITLRTHIAELLDCVCAWTPRWFNKPKFHLLLHLPDHVRLFGPASLFATESFESFNAVIRGWSIHSNRSAPS
ncbi:hypothetical protein JB92DRAFT_2738424, partial [Gautieria morchelliformis]